METLIAIAVAVGVMNAPAKPKVEQPKVAIICGDAWHRAGCAREKPHAPNKSDWLLSY